MKPIIRRLVAMGGAAALVATFATGAAAVDPEPSSTNLTWVASGPLQAHHPITLQASVTTAVDGWATDATMDFDATEPGAFECHGVAVDAGNATLCTIENPAAGTYHYTATYSGNATVATSTSTELELVVGPDTLDATGVGVNYGTFYPIRDTYRDTLRVRGTRQESIAVTIRIYNANNKRVALVTKALASGAYAYEWNGKSGTTLLPAGKYRIVQTLVDAAGTTKAFTSYANLSHKKLVTKTKTITKDGVSVAAGTIGHVYRAGRAAHIKAGSTGAVAGWQFKIPAAVSYTSIQFRANVGARLAAPPSLIAMQNFSWCTDWNTGCFDRVKTIGNASGAAKWYATSGSPTTHRKGLVVRGLVGVGTGSIYDYKVAVKVTYKVLQ
jgi:hypothetical protein